MVLAITLLMMERNSNYIQTFTPFFFLSFFFLTYSISAAITNTDQSALLSLKSKITSDPHDNIMQNWTVESPVCDWTGVTCGKRHHRVTYLNISYMSLAGEIPPELGNLSFLISLDVTGNDFSGLIPKDLSRLRRLRFVNMSENSFAGEVPSCFALLPRLEVLNLNNNSFTSLDSFLLSFANESKLETLRLSFNSIHGKIPESIGNLRSLKHLFMTGNKLSGSLPSSLANLTNLVTLDMYSNYIEGSLPEAIGNTLRYLSWLNLYNNQLIGSIPSSLFNISTLQILALTENSLSGTLPDDMCLHLPLLRQLFLGGNELYGEIPSNISMCSQLQVLNLDFNKITGSIPDGIGNLRNLSYLNFFSNQLTGSVPSGLFNTSTLQYLGLSRNNLSGTLADDICLHRPLLRELYLAVNGLYGEIPSNISLCSHLRVVALAENNFTGEIPRSLGELVELEILDLGVNQLSGSIPINIFNTTSLRKFQVAANRLSGNLSSKSDYFLPNLETFLVAGNDFGGVFPNFILNSSNLIGLDLSQNKMIGPVPINLGDLRFLQYLDLGFNGFMSESVTTELSFINSLTNCRNLQSLSLSSNPLSGVIPAAIGNLSSSLTDFYAAICGVKGNIPIEIGNLSGLVTLSLGSNNLIGEIPITLHNLVNLQRLSIEDNRITGLIPNNLCELMSLGDISLDTNQLIGPIPECIGNISSLKDIYLNNNNLTSGIPPSIWNIEDLLNIDVSSNSLAGSLSPQIGNLKAAISVDLSMNQFSGDIPSTFEGLIQLQELYLANNNFQGLIPESLGSMVSLLSLDLSHNRLNGTIPKSLEALQYLEYFNVSFNELSGEIPINGPFRNLTSRSFMFNSALCGPSRFNVSSCPESRHRSKKKTTLRPLLISIGIGTALVFIICLAYAVMRYRRKRAPLTASDIPSATGQPARFSYYDLLHATENYSENNLLGKGSFGSVYKGVLRDGTILAVKVFHVQLERSLRSFEVECGVLRSLRHRNLVKVLGSCTNQDFKAIVLEYMQNGSLEKCLYSANIDVMQRLDIMIDVACAMEYLHHGCSAPVVHCDLKPANVLLDENMVAHVGDFGITKFLNEGESITYTTTLATLGYMAPEYGSEGIVSTRCDVYSYGIMLLETFTRKRPSDEMFSGDITLRDWVKASMPDAVVQVIDADLMKQSDDESNFNKELDCICSVLELGLVCSATSPVERKNMKDVAAEIKKIKMRFMTSYRETSRTVRVN